MRSYGGQEVQHGDEQDARRFVKVDQTPQVRIGQDTGWHAHVVPDDDRVGCALQHVPGVREDYRVVIHVDDARSRVGGHRHLVYVPMVGNPVPMSISCLMPASFTR